MASPRARNQRLPHHAPKSPTTPTPTARTAPSVTRPETPDAKAASMPPPPPPALEVPMDPRFTTGAGAAPVDTQPSVGEPAPEPDAEAAPPQVGDTVTLVDGNGTAVKDYVILTLTPSDWRGQTRADLGATAEGPAVLHTVLLPGGFARLPTRADTQPTEPPPAVETTLQDRATGAPTTPTTPAATPPINAPGSTVAPPELDAANAAIQARAARALSGLGFTTQVTTPAPAPTLTTVPTPKTVATPGGTAPLPNPTPPAAQTIGVLPNPAAPGQAPAAGAYCWPQCDLPHKHAICPPACKGNHLHRYS